MATPRGPRTAPLLAALLLGATVLAGCASDDGGEEDATLVARLEGSGASTTEGFTLRPGLTTLDFESKGAGPLNVMLEPVANGTAREAINETSPSSGVRITGARPGGVYRLVIDAPGAWSIDVRQPEPGASSLRRDFSGDGPGVTNVFHLGMGRFNFQLEHDGAGDRFLVDLYDRNGENIARLADHAGGPYSDSVEVAILFAGAHMLEVRADGPWTIKLLG